MPKPIGDVKECVPSTQEKYGQNIELHQPQSKKRLENNPVWL